MKNLPTVKLGIVAVGRDCFPRELSASRRVEVVKEAKALGLDIFEVETVVENELHVLKAMEEIKNAGVNALCVYLGNFGPEGPETMLAQKFHGPSMFAAAAEESGNNLFGGRGDAFCGMLNASYNLKLRGVTAYIPEYPVGTPSQVALMLKDFSGIARVYIGLKNLKIFSFGPRPYNFLACNAPIKPFYDLGVEVMENSELDLFESFNKHKDDSRIKAVAKEMADELGKGNTYPTVLDKLAQYEITLMDWIDSAREASSFAVFANKCWPAFQTQFGFVPCYVNSRMAMKGYPVACETDMYGAMSEFMISCATQLPATLLDINNTVPQDMYLENKIKNYKLTDLFMGFHCGNTAICALNKGALKHQLIMHRLLEPNSEPNITRGTLEGTIKNGDITLFRLQGTADCQLKSYIAEGEVLDIDPKSFGSIGVFAVPEMGRFYRHALIENGFPHHAGVAFGHTGKILFEAVKLLGIKDIYFNQPSGMLYKSENPFA